MPATRFSEEPGRPCLVWSPELREQIARASGIEQKINGRKSSGEQFNVYSMNFSGNALTISGG
jgi:hypothetical protein